MCVQTWLPFPIRVCLNGREDLARQLDKAKIGYEKRDNCFVRIYNLQRAQQILDRLVTRKWQSRRARPRHGLPAAPRHATSDRRSRVP